MKKVEKLRERELHRARLEEDVQLQKLLDESAIMRHARRLNDTG
jgi:flagellar biosynthesis chaperone FliJ